MACMQMEKLAMLDLFCSCHSWFQNGTHFGSYHDPYIIKAVLNYIFYILWRKYNCCLPMQNPPPQKLKWLLAGFLLVQAKREARLQSQILAHWVHETTIALVILSIDKSTQWCITADRVNWYLENYLSRNASHTALDNQPQEWLCKISQQLGNLDPWVKCVLLFQFNMQRHM